MLVALLLYRVGTNVLGGGEATKLGTRYRYHG